MSRVETLPAVPLLSRPLAFLVLSTIVLVGEPASARNQASELTLAVRELLESSLREQAGIGFVEFDCAVQLPLAPGQRFTCNALDEEGDRLRYTLEVDDDGTTTVIRASQPADSLGADALESLSAPCRGFLQAFEQADWETLLAGLHASLRAEIDRNRVVSRLQELLVTIGDLETPVATWYSSSESGAHQLEYKLPAQVGGAVARFELAPENDSWKILAFLVSAEAGTALSASLISSQASVLLSQALGTTVSRVEGPFHELVAKGDQLEASAHLESGEVVPVLAQQTGHSDDFDANDYFFSVLDAEIVVTKGVEERVENVTGVECEARIVPDGGEIPCLVHREGAPPLELVLSRRGAEHRIRSAQPTGP